MRSQRSFLYSAVAGLFLSVAALTARADDTDLFTTKVDSVAERANVVVFLDNTANWNLAFDFEKAALVTTFLGLDDRFNVGLMMFTETGAPNTNTDGAYVRYAVRQMTGTNRTNLASVITGLDKVNDKSNGGKTGVSMYEVYQYFRGGAAYAGAGKVKASPYGDQTYNSPISSACQKNFLIYISNGPASDNSNDTTTAKNFLTGFGGNGTTIPLTPNGSQDNTADEWARFMYATDIRADLNNKQNIITFTIDVLPGTTGQSPGWTALLKSMARQGHGQYFEATNLTTFSNALKKIFNQIQAVNSVFASSTLPVSVSVRGTYLNQVYMGVFRPDAFRSPRWFGNLKQYKLALDSDAQPVLVDKAGNPIESGTTGFIVPDAQSFWTTTSTYWTYAPDGSGQASDSPDGELVEKGAAAQRLRTVYATSQASRNVYTCTTCTDGQNLNSEAFDTANSAITTAMLGGGTPFTVSSMARTGAVVDVTTSAAHDFVDGQAVVIAGATPTAYNGTVGITVTGANSFQYFIAETPESPATGVMTMATPGLPQVLLAGNMVRSGTTVTVTLAAHGFTTGTVVNVSGATQPEYNGGKTITVVDANTFTFPITLGPAAPALGGSPTATIGGTSATIAAIEKNGNSVTVTLSAARPASFIAGASFILANVTPAATYSGAPGFIIANVGNACTGGGVQTRRFCFNVSETPASPATGTIVVDGGGTVLNVLSIVRTLTTATVTTSVPHGLIGTAAVTLAGADQTDYNGAKTVTVTGLDTVTFSVTTGPTSPPTGTITAQSTAANRDTLINWVRGQDNFDDENANNSFTDVRSSVHGDVLHSRPAVVNYFTGGADDVVVYYGSNDGLFHAVQGGQLDSQGTELWSFVAKEFFPKLNRLVTQQPPIGSAAPFAPRPYFFDGGIGVYQQDDVAPFGQPEKVLLFPTMRRGGRTIYAFDVSVKGTPKLLWRKGCPNTSGSAGCSTGYEYLGQTWSEPKTGKIYASTDPILIFGGGYDNFADDAQPATAATMGNRIYIVNAITGEVIKQFGASDSGDADKAITNSVAADVYPLDSNNDGYLDRVYASDTGGNVWRLDINDASPANWKIFKLASISGTLAVDKRKFLFGVSASRVTDDPTSPYDAILIGSGDREHPTETDAAYNTNNRFYMFKDTKIGLDGSGMTTITETDLYDVTSDAISSTDTATATAAAAALKAAKGWMLRLTGVGEKTVSGATTAAGTTFFNTHRPTQLEPGTCNNLGEARLYQLGFKDATSVLPEGRFVTHPGGGFPPTPIYVVVDVPSGTGTRRIEGIVTGTNVRVPGTTRLDARYRTYWYELKDD